MDIAPHMTMNDPIDDYMDGAARAIGLPLDAAWRPAVKANLETLFAFAALVDAFPLPDDVAPAPIYRA